MISIIIPAHNEGSVIARNLNALVPYLALDEAEIIVVCNGCSDNTAEIARRYGPIVRVVETDIPSKASALNIGDKIAQAFPRIYVDADIVIAIDGIRALAARLEQGDVHIVAPTALLDLSNCHRFVRAYYRIRSLLPSSRHGIGGSGVYALSKVGRARFGEFPNLTADDAYARLQFCPHERETLAFAASTVFAPRTIRQLIAVRTRVYFGALELSRRFPELQKNNDKKNNLSLLILSKKLTLWPDLAVYLYVNLNARLRALNSKSRANLVWQRDDTSRQSNS